MRFKDVFSIIGPSMVGPSSSHTAGAVRLGRTARHIFGEQPEEAEISFYGSFAETYRGHGTDLAIVAGLMDFDTDHAGIRDALDLADAAGIRVSFRTASKAGIHPNTAMIRVRKGDREDRVTGCSIGGGNIEITNVNGFDVKFTLVYPTLLAFHDDRPGMVSDITGILKTERVNISNMDVDRKSRSGDALTVIETDERLSADVQRHIMDLADMHRVCMVDLTHKEGIV